MGLLLTKYASDMKISSIIKFGIFRKWIWSIIPRISGSACHFAMQNL